MKTIAALFSIFLLALTLVPCTDVVGEPHEEEATVHAPHHHDHDHEGETDDCSPLCQCQCCHVNVTLTNALCLEAPASTVYVLATQYSEMVSEAFPFSQFKPPIA